MSPTKRSRIRRPAAIDIRIYSQGVSHENLRSRNARASHHPRSRAPHFGPKHLPKLGSALGKTIKNLREGFSSGDGVIKKSEAEEEEAPAPKRKKKAPKQIEAAATVEEEAAEQTATA